MPKKMIIPGALIASFLLAALLWWQLSPKPKTKLQTTGIPLKIGVGYWPGQFWITIADQKGWFKEAGLNIELIDTNSDYYGSLNDLAAGKTIDTHGFSLFDMMQYNAQGNDLVMVIHQDYSVGSEAVITKPEIEHIRDLKGKTIGVHQNTYLEYILTVALSRAGCSLEEVNLLNIQGEKAADALANGQADAVITYEPHAANALQKGPGRKRFDTSQIPGISPNGTVFHRGFIEKRPEDVQAFVQVWHRTTRFIQEHPAEAFGIIADFYKIPRADVIAFSHGDKILDLEYNLQAYTYATEFSSLYGAAYQINEYMIKKGTIKKHLDSTTFLEDRFIRNIRY